MTLIEFEKGIRATFNLGAFIDLQNITLKIMGTKGEIRGVDTLNQIEVRFLMSMTIKELDQKMLTVVLVVVILTSRMTL